jgi:hypothetical protein
LCQKRLKLLWPYRIIIPEHTPHYIKLGALAQPQDSSLTRSRIVQLKTAPQAYETLAGIAHLQQQAGQLEEALMLIVLIQHHPSSYQESKDRVAAVETALRMKLPPAQVQAALAQGQSSELWATVAAVSGQVDTEQPLKQPVQDLRIELDGARQDKQVAEITESDYFQRLLGQADDLRQIIKQTETL